jgi:hypothetical protein
VKTNALQRKHFETHGTSPRQRFSTLPPRRGKGVGMGANVAEFCATPNGSPDA